MAKLAVLHYPDPRLRNKAQPVADIDASVRRLAGDMLETMYAEHGIGLAAIQVNVQQRVVVVDLSAQQNEPMTLVNPEVLEKTGAGEMEEGCLSVPDFSGLVRRAERIKYRYQDLDGKETQAWADGLLAVCIQHEIDHLDGRLFIDYLSALKVQRLRKKIRKTSKVHAL